MCTLENREQLPMLNEQEFHFLKESADFDIAPCENAVDLEDTRRFSKLKISPEQKMHISALLQQVPVAMAAGKLAQAYTVSFPEGLPHTLTALHQGGYGSMIRVNGKFAGTASFYEMGSQAAVLGAFSAMSVATGQYFLTQINSQLKMMNLKFDKILEFLYGDKKAELMSEVSFAKYAYENYSSIMAHEQQRLATLISLQESKKVAMKDIEFYMGDLESTVNSEAKNYSDLEEIAYKTFQIRDSLELSSQLYIMSSMLEIYYAQNHDTEYIHSLENTASVYLDKCEKRMLSGFSILNRRISEYKAKPLEKMDKSAIEGKLSGLVEQLNSGEESSMHKTMHTALNASTQKAEYYIAGNGDMYARELDLK